MNLTQREKDICRCLIEGMSNIEIAQKLFISKYTVKSHISRIISTKKIRNRVHLAYLLGKENIIEL